MRKGDRYDKKNELKKVDYYVLIPLIIFLVVVGTVTNYDLIYTIFAGIIGVY